MSAPFTLVCRGRDVAFSKTGGDEWRHDQSPAAAILGGETEAAIYRRADTLLWCLNSGLAGGEDAARSANRKLSSIRHPNLKRWDAGSRESDTYRSAGEPFCVPLALYRERLTHDFEYWRPHGADVPRSMRVAVEACRASKEELAVEPPESLCYFNAAINRAGQVVCEIEARTDQDGGHDPAGTLAGLLAVYGDIVHLGIFQTDPPGGVVAQVGARQALKSIFTDTVTRAWFWDGCLPGTVESLPPRRRWLYAWLAACKADRSGFRHPSLPRWIEACRNPPPGIPPLVAEEAMRAAGMGALDD